jgi:hypothetical protein
MSDWWEKPYKGGPMVPVAGFPRPVRIGSEDGPDVHAYKRTVCRLGRWDPWKPPWTEEYTKEFANGRGTGKVGDTGIRGVQRQQVMPETGEVDERTFNTLRSCKVPDGPHEGEMAMDSVAVSLIKEAWQQFGGGGGASPEERVREQITKFCEQGIGEPDWYYSQARAINISINPNGPATSDCSGSVIQIFWFAKQKTGLNVPCPAKQGFSGYGNTNYYEDDWGKVTNGQYLVGDMAHYDGHVCLCYHKGNADTADWWSFGSEPPSSRKLHYRSDFRFVVRPDLIA